MNFKTISRTVGIALLVSALFMFFSILVSVAGGNDSALAALLISFTITAIETTVKGHRVGFQVIVYTITQLVYITFQTLVFRLKPVKVPGPGIYEIRQDNVLKFKACQHIC